MASPAVKVPTPIAWRRSKTCTKRFGQMIDTHTADGVKVAREHMSTVGVPMIVLETALPIKFASTIVEALGQEPIPSCLSLTALRRMP